MYTKALGGSQPAAPSSGTQQEKTIKELKERAPPPPITASP
jgi:hypothetical protein